MSKLDPLYEPWNGNAEAMAADIGEPGVKVRQWRNREFIPQEYWQRIMDEAAAKRGKVLPPELFIQLHAKPAPAPSLMEARAA